MNTTPKRCLSGQRCDPVTLVEAIYCLVHHSSVPLKVIAEAMGKSPGYLSDAANPDRGLHAFQAASLVPAMRAADNYMPLQVMAQQCGRVLVCLPHADAPAGDIRQRFMKAAKELGDVSSEVERALAGDGEIDEEEFARIDRELSETVEAVAQMRAEIASRVKGRAS